MKTIEVEDELYRYIASHTLHIGESASDILRRMLKVTVSQLAECSAVKTGAVGETPNPRLQNKNCPVERVRTIRELLLSDEYALQKRAVNRFMLVLSTLYRLEPDEFSQATRSLQGRTRIYFAGDEQTLVQNGIHTKPRQIPGTPCWVITNTNTGRKCSMIEHIMLEMKFPQELSDKVCGTI